MGKVKNKKVKRIARTLLEKFPNLFTVNFEHNKLQIKGMQELKLSKKERNQVAGYITRIIKQQTKKKKEEEQ
jgi:small subunit ribosomal protein S17e